MKKRVLCLLAAAVAMVSLCLPTAMAASSGSIAVELHYQSGNTTKYVAGIEIELYCVAQPGNTAVSIDGLTPVQAIVTDTQGIALFCDVPYGTYVLHQKDKKAAAYVFDDVTVELPYLDADGNANNCITVQPKLAPPKTPSKTPAPPQPPVLGRALPQTGLLQWPIPVLGVCGVALLGTGCLLARRKGKDA